MFERAECSGFGRLEHGVAFVGDLVGAFDGAQAGGDPGFAGGDDLAVAPAVGAFGQVLAEQRISSYSRSRDRPVSRAASSTE